MVDVILVSLPEKFWREVFIEWVQLERERKRESMCVQSMHAKNLIAYQDMNNLEVSLTLLDNFDSYATKANSSAVKRAGRYELLTSRTQCSF